MVRLEKCIFLALFLFGLVVSGVNGESLSGERLLVLNKSDGTLSIVEPTKLEVLTTVPVGIDPHEVVISADGKRAFASNYGNGHTLAVVDLVEGKALEPIDLGPLYAPHGLVESEGKIYFTAERSKVIGSCDLESGKVDWVLGVGEEVTHMIRLAKDGTLVTTNLGSASVSLIRREGIDGKITHIPVGAGPEGFDLTSDGKTIWVANSRDGSVSIVDIAEKKVVHSIQVETKRSNRLEFTPDEKLALVSDLGADHLVVIDVAKREVIKRIPIGGIAAGILIEPAGERAFIALPAKNEVVVIDLKLLEVSDRLATGRGPDGMAWLAE